MLIQKSARTESIIARKLLIAEFCNTLTPKADIHGGSRNVR
jgi:hypothetical protein